MQQLRQLALTLGVGDVFNPYGTAVPALGTNYLRARLHYPQNGTAVLKVLLRGFILNRTYGTHKTIHVAVFFQQYLVLFTMAPRNTRALHSRGLGTISLELASGMMFLCENAVLIVRRLHSLEKSVGFRTRRRAMVFQCPIFFFLRQR